MLQVQTITRTYKTFEDARNVAVRLAEAGIQPERIGLLGQQAGGDDNTATAAGVGGAAGAATGLALGLGALTLPGVGPIVATGWFLSGAVTGALAGGVLGALVDAGVPANDAERHAGETRRAGLWSRCASRSPTPRWRRELWMPQCPSRWADLQMATSARSFPDARSRSQSVRGN